MRSRFDSRPVLSEEANTSENTHCGKDSSAERKKKDENIQRIVRNDGKKIEAAMRTPEVKPLHVCGLIDSWLSFADRDKETPEEEQRQKYGKILAFIEEKLEEAEPDSASGDRSINLVFSYIVTTVEKR